VTQLDDFARRVTASLDQGLSEIDTTTSLRLASMRRLALAGDTTTQHRGHAVLVWVSRHAWLTALLALAMLVAGGWFTQNHPRVYSPETDILLLTGDLPPNAYADKTFSQWLKSRAPF
jgi:multidrug efflux pump subunit AcrB